MAKLEIKNIINKHQNIPALVIGHGPNLNEHSDKLSEYKEKGYIIIATNDYYNFYNTPVNYCVICNHIYSISKNYEIMNKHGAIIFYSDVQELTSRKRVDNILTVDYLPYDFRHYNNNTCHKNKNKPWKYMWKYEHHDPNEVHICCQHFIPGRLTIQEEIQKLSKYNEHCSMGDVNVLRQLMFGMLMGCNPIYIVGIDLDYRQGYAKVIGKQYATPNVSYQTDMKLQNKIHNDFKIINESAKLLNINIINTNKNLFYEEFERGNIK